MTLRGREREAWVNCCQVQDLCSSAMRRRTAKYEFRSTMKDEVLDFVVKHCGRGPWAHRSTDCNEFLVYLSDTSDQTIFLMRFSENLLNQDYHPGFR